MHPTLMVPESAPAPADLPRDGVRHRLHDALFDHVVNPAIARVGRIHATAEAPLLDPPLFRPNVTGRRYGVAHYNVVIPDLPEPHRFLACMVIVGQTGTRVFDIDHAVQDSPRRTATVGAGTAVSTADASRAYSVDRECHLREDGSLLRFGEELEIAGTFPDFHVKLQRGELELDIELSCTDQITWFARSPVYDHIGFPAHYSGTISWAGTTEEIAGVCSFEYARGLSPQVIRDRSVPARLKLPWDMFSYQVIALDPQTLLMLAHTTVGGRPLLTSAYLRRPGGESSRWVHGVEYEPLAVFDQPLMGPDGRATQVVSSFRWTIRDDKRGATELAVVLDTPLVAGWIGGAHFEGEHRGHAVEGRGYVEYADMRDSGGPRLVGSKS